MSALPRSLTQFVRSLRRAAPALSQPAGSVYELGRRELSLLPTTERDAQQLGYRDFLLSVAGPLRLTLMVHRDARRLFLWLKDDPGNAQALAALAVPYRRLGPESPDALRSAVANPGLPPIAEPAGRLPLSPREDRAKAHTSLARPHLRILESGTGFRQLMAVDSYPDVLDELILERLWWHGDDLLFAMRLTPLAPEEARHRLDRRLTQLHAGSYLRRQRGQLPDAETDRAQTDALQLRQSLVEGRERLFASALLVAADGPDQASCEARAARLRALFAEMGFGLRVQLGLQRYAEDWLQPEYGEDEPPARLLSASTLSCLHLLPAAAPPQTGELLGHHVRDGTPIRRDRLHAANPLAVVLGQPGHGKSALIKSELLRHRPQALLVVDPEGEYGPVLTALQGELRGDLPEVSSAPQRIGLSLRGVGDTARPALLRAAAAWALAAADALQQQIPTWLTIDEAHLWLSSAAEPILLDLSKRARKRGLIVTLATQNVGDFLASPSGRIVLANAGRLVLFRQQSADLPRLGEVLGVAERALDFLRRCAPGEALLLDEGGPVPMRLRLTEEELRLVDTRPGFARPL